MLVHQLKDGLMWRTESGATFTTKADPVLMDMSWGWYYVGYVLMKLSRTVPLSAPFEPF